MSSGPVPGKGEWSIVAEYTASQRNAAHYVNGYIEPRQIGARAICSIVQLLATSYNFCIRSVSSDECATVMTDVRSLTPRGLGLVALALMCGCLTASPFHTQAAATPELRPEVFFAGITHGDGTLVQRWKSPRKLQVEGRGAMQPDGTFRLDQAVTFSDGATEKRTWYLRRQGTNSYTGTLSDASGKVTAETHGNVFHLRYLLRQPAVYMDQQLYLQPDGRTVLNVATVSVLGIPWARLSERITRSGSDSSAQ